MSSLRLFSIFTIFPSRHSANGGCRCECHHAFWHEHDPRAWHDFSTIIEPQRRTFDALPTLQPHNHTHTYTQYLRKENPSRWARRSIYPDSAHINKRPIVCQWHFSGNWFALAFECRHFSFHPTNQFRARAAVVMCMWFFFLPRGLFGFPDDFLIRIYCADQMRDKRNGWVIIYDRKIWLDTIFTNSAISPKHLRVIFINLFFNARNISSAFVCENQSIAATHRTQVPRSGFVLGLWSFHPLGYHMSS